MEKFEFEFNKSFVEYKSTLKETSFDSAKNDYLCNDTQVIIFDFDNIIKKLYPDRQPKSFDCILFDNKNIFCIEFKNSYPPDIDNSNVQGKLINSRSVLDDFCKTNNINKKDYKFIYCVVFKPYSNVSQANRLYKARISGRTIFFDLEKYKGIYFDEIITNDTDYFIRNYNYLIVNTKLNC